MAFKKLNHCLACNSKNLKKVLNLNKQPLANSYHNNSKELEKYPLGVNLCQDCYHIQLGHVVDPSFLFQNNYTYVSGTSSVFVEHLKNYAEYVVNLFNIKTEFHLSLLPTATPFSRNAIFSGLYPDEFPKEFPDQWGKMIRDETSMNRYESEFLKSYLQRNNLSQISMNYTKFVNPEDGQKFANHINEYKNTNLLALVVNFVDMLGHSRSESNVLKEMIPDESAYRKAICSWMEQSWLKDVFEQISEWDKTIILTSDHGSIRVKKPVQVKGDRETSDGIRYKYGKNLHVSSKVAMKIDSPANYRLPVIDGATDYILSKDEYYFLYPNNYNRFARRYENSFQHGGISMDEMIVPVGILTGKG